MVVHTHPGCRKGGIEGHYPAAPVIEVKTIAPSVGKPAGMVIGIPPLGTVGLGLDRGLEAGKKKNKKREKRP